MRQFSRLANGHDDDEDDAPGRSFNAYLCVYVSSGFIIVSLYVCVYLVYI